MTPKNSQIEEGQTKQYPMFTIEKVNKTYITHTKHGLFISSRPFHWMVYGV
jgi:hypothetical protein